MTLLTSTISGVLPVLVFGILLGAGLPAIFALGLRLGSPAAGVAGESPTPALAPVSTIRKVGAWLCFAVVVLAVAAGIVFLVLTGHR